MLDSITEQEGLNTIKINSGLLHIKNFRSYLNSMWILLKSKKYNDILITPIIKSAYKKIILREK